MWTLARKILLHDKIKFLVAAAGVSASVWLVLLQVGLYLGFMQNTSNIIDHSTADLWVTGEGNENFDFAGPIDEREYYRIAGVPGVARAERLVLAYGSFKLKVGGTTGVEVVGLERDARLFAPWSVVTGDAARLREADGIVVDRSEAAKLNLTGELGERREISGVRAKIVALTRGIRSFTTSPFVFTNLDSARAYARLRPDQITYVLVQLEPGADLAAVRREINALGNLDAYSRQEFSLRAQDYWSTRTGVGTTFFMTAVMGVLVGLVVVGQILYNGTLEHLKEYGTMKAMGAKNALIVRTILLQALFAAAIGFVTGTILALFSQAGVRAANLNLVLSPELLAGTALLTVAMCALAATLSVLKVLRLDPAMVFKG